MPAAALSPRPVNPWLLAATVPLAAFIELLDTTIVNVAVEHVAGSLSASLDEATYVLTSYLIANVVVLPLSGYLTGLLGRKNYYLWCVAIFTISSALCGLATSLGFLVFARVLQGLGGGGLQPVAQAILTDAFPPERQSAAQAVFSVTAVAAPALGPVLGGWLIDNYNWRWIFLVNIPFGLLAFFLNLRLLQDPPSFLRFSLKRRKFDYQGLLLLAVCLGSLQVVLDRGQIDDWFDSSFITAFAAASLLSFAAFLWWELHHEFPIVDLRLFKNRNFSLSLAAMFLMGFVFFAANYLQPLFCQTLLGWTATWAGLALSPSAVVFIAVMPFLPKLVRLMTPRYMVVAGFIIHGLACWLMTGWNLQVSYSRILDTRILEIVGLVGLLAPINIMTFSFLPKDKITSGAGLLSLARNFGASCGVSIAATILARRVQVHQSILISHLTPGDVTYRQALDDAARYLFHHGMSRTDAASASVVLIGRRLLEQARMLSYLDAFYILTIGSLLAAPLPLLIRKAKPNRRS